MTTLAHDLADRGHPPSSSTLPFDRWLVGRIQRRFGNAPIAFVLWDGTTSGAPNAPYRVIIKDRAMLFDILRNGDVAFGDGFSAGRVEVQGNLVAALEAVYRAGATWRPRRMWDWKPWINSMDDSRANIHHHYDIGNDFYRLWLDREMLYTCAYFPSEHDTLETAQIAKMDHVCQKLGLRPGERVIDAGCGWGALAIHMAKHYGVTVRAYNISGEQIREARRRAAEERLADRVEFIEDDYRHVGGTCEAFVSVGMLEHVGIEHYADLGKAIDRTLDPHVGRGLLHFIGRNQAGELNPWIRRRIFPGAYPPVLREVFARVLEPWNLSVTDVENLRLHYAKTLEHWLARYEQAADTVTAMFDEHFTRAWRLYLAGSQATFATGWLQLFQVTFARGASNGVPWLRHGRTSARAV